jgi:hypothetical protein
MLLATRAQAFILTGRIHEALRDLNLTLSPQCTNKDSSKALTAECSFHRMKLLSTMARYNEAQADYREVAKFLGEIGEELDDEDLKLKEDLDCRAAAGDDSEQRRRDELMRAIDVSATSIHHEPRQNNSSQARGFILSQRDRATFPLPIQQAYDPFGPNFDPESMTISFDTLDSKPDRHLPDPNLTPILIPVTIRVPYYFPNPDIQTPFSTCEENPVSENETLGSFIEGVFTSIATTSHKPVNREILASAMAHGRDGVLIVVSSRGRLFKIPRETTIKDAVAGAQWPRQSNATTFEDLRRTPRKRSDEIDGIELIDGWRIEVYVVAKDKLGAL